VTEPVNEWLEMKYSRAVSTMLLGKGVNLSIEEVETGAAAAYLAMAEEYNDGTLFRQPLEYYSDTSYPKESIVDRDLAILFQQSVSMLKRRGLKPLLEVKDVKAEFMDCNNVGGTMIYRDWALGYFALFFPELSLNPIRTVLGGYFRLHVKITATERLTMVPLSSEEGEGKERGKGPFMREEHMIELLCSCPSDMLLSFLINPYWIVRGVVKDDDVFNKCSVSTNRPSWSPDVSISRFNLQGKEHAAFR
jgi:hypothetical protein